MGLRNVLEGLGLVAVPPADRVQALERLASGQLVTASSLPLVQGDVASLSDLSTDAALAFGINVSSTSITRREAMRVPAFARGRNTIAGTIGTLALFAAKGDRRVDTWSILEQPDPNTTRQHVLTWTVDQLLCYGIAWWRVTERDRLDYPTRAEWIDRRRVTIERDQVRIDGEPVDDADLIRFDGAHEGVLAFGSDVLRGALALEAAVKRYADNPSPTTVLSDKRPADADVRDLTATEVDDVLERWNTGRGPTRYVNRYLGADTFGWNPQQLDLTSARQQAAVQVARLLGMPSRKVNAPSESSMTYSTTAADRLELIDETLAPYLAAIEQRLSMPDVTPRGWRVLFDRDGFTQGTTQDRLENAVTASGGPVMSVDEARARYLDLPPAADLPAAPPAPTPQETP